jgi:hypothetical protein
MALPSKGELEMRCFLVAAAVSVAAITSAAAEPCTGPFQHCARAVIAQCSIDPDGIQRITYWDFSGKTTQFEQCVGQVYLSKGLPNPYVTGDTGGSEELPFPRSEILFPNYNN